jgi:hypothetical protein
MSTNLNELRMMLAEEKEEARISQTKSILLILKDCIDLEEAIERVEALLRK